MSWVNAKSPVFGMHISRGEREALNILFVSLLKRSAGFTAIVSLMVVMVVFALASFELSFMTRIAEPAVITCLAMVCIINSAIFSMAIYMRAHREEPMLPVSMASGALTALIAYLGSIHSVLLMSVGYLLITVVMVLPWTLHLFMRYFRRLV
jgi:hypothetical protein